MSDTVSFTGDVRQWAQYMFGGCKLGDPRRTERLVDFATRQAKKPEGSVSEVCAESQAAAEGAYRLLRNKQVRGADIDAAPFGRTAELCARRKTILAIQDTTMLSFPHAVSKQMGNVGSGRGFVVHSTLAVDADNREVLGLLDQERWSRGEPKRQSKVEQRNTPYRDKESYKWESSWKRIDDRLGSTSNIIGVCDREADIYDHLQYASENNLRFVIRARADRRLESSRHKLWKVMAAQPIVGKRDQTVTQRGSCRLRTGASRSARQRRVAKLSIRAHEVTLSWGGRGKDKRLREPIAVNVVYVREAHPPKDTAPIEWMLLTSEPVDDFQKAMQVVDYYAARWMIEQFHKAWKSGCRIEQRRHQSPDNLERIAAITAHIAVRLLQLGCLADAHPEKSCDCAFPKEHWQILYATAHPRRKMPRNAPSLLWALTAMAKLVGWRDSKQTGTMGWDTLWKGWLLLQERVQGWLLATHLLGRAT
jgi:hypothetical protein